MSGLPVVDRAKGLVGIVTEGDFLRRSELGTERRRPSWLELFTSRTKSRRVRTCQGRSVDEVMTTDVETIFRRTLRLTNSSGSWRRTRLNGCSLSRTASWSGSLRGRT
ncbi:CBS domain-containing protein [Caballeronia sordidicola]|uniref:CBS domain-containing protein n=1 Tax=Caballeronia sordidicola TaxID=196367 RepID=UPI0035B5621F